MPSLLERLREALEPRYEVEAEVASGGMATVFRARDTSLERVVAVKVLRPDLATATGEARFLREARVLASFSHPNMVSIHDAGEADGLFFYIMDFVEGDTLATRLEQGPLDAYGVLRMGRDLLAALQRIHEAGVVHRDVKPGNVFLVDGRTLLADFGVASVPASGDDVLTREGGAGLHGAGADRRSLGHSPFRCLRDGDAAVRGVHRTPMAGAHRAGAGRLERGPDRRPSRAVPRPGGRSGRPVAGRGLVRYRPAGARTRPSRASLGCLPRRPSCSPCSPIR
jgi:serine/threonine protein kinase